MRIGVIGSGNGGTTLAYDMASKNIDVMISDLPDFLDNVKIIKKNQGIYGRIKEAEQETFYKVLATENIREVLEFANVIFISAPAYGTKLIAETCKNYIGKNHRIILCPGTIGGAFEFKKALGYEYNDKSIHISETSTLPYATRLNELGHVIIHHYVKTLHFSTLPSEKTMENLDLIRELFPSFVPVKNIMYTSISCGNPVIHPAVVILNSALIERTKGNFRFYADGITRSVGNLIQAVDKERIYLGSKMNLDIPTEPEIGVAEGYMKIANYLEGYNESEAFKDIMAPQSLDNRFMDEDIGYGLLFWASLGELYDVKLPVINAMIDIASAIVAFDYRKANYRSVSALSLTKEIIDRI